MNSHLTLGRKVHFSCGHRYFLDSLSEDQNREKFGACASSHGHGHNYLLDVYIKGPLNPETGMIVDLVELDKLIKKVVDELDHKFLNEDVVFFKTHLPTTENIAHYLGNQLLESLKPFDFELSHIHLYENESLWVEVVY